MTDNEIEVLIFTNSEIDARLAEIEAEVPDMRYWYESEYNHGDSCWMAEVEWHELAGEYDRLRWLRGAEWRSGNA